MSSERNAKRKEEIHRKMEKLPEPNIDYEVFQDDEPDLSEVDLPSYNGLRLPSGYDSDDGDTGGFSEVEMEKLISEYNSDSHPYVVANRNEAEKLRAVISDLNMTLEKNRREFEETNFENVKMKKELEECNKTIFSLNSQMNEMRSKQEFMRTEKIEELRGEKLNELRRENRQLLDLKDEYLRQKNEIEKKYTQTLRTKEKTVESSKHEIDRLNKELVQTNGILDIRSRALEEEKQKVKDLTSKRMAEERQKEEEIGKKDEEVEELMGEIANLRKQVESFEDLRTDLKTGNKERSTLRMKLKNMSTDLNSKKIIITDLQQKIAQAKPVSQHYEEEIAKLKEEMLARKLDESQRERKFVSEKKKLNDLGSKNAELKRSLEMKEKQILEMREDFERKFRELEDEKEEHVKNICEKVLGEKKLAEEMNSKMGVKARRFVNQIRELEAKINKKKRKIVMLKNNVTALESTNVALKKDFAEVSQRGDLNKKDQFDSMRKDFTQQINRYKEQVIKEKNIVNQLEEKLRLEEVKTEEAKEKAILAENLKKTLMEKYEEKKKIITSLKEKLNSLNMNMHELEGKNVALYEQINKEKSRNVSIYENDVNSLEQTVDSLKKKNKMLNQKLEKFRNEHKKLLLETKVNHEEKFKKMKEYIRRVRQRDAEKKTKIQLLEIELNRIRKTMDLKDKQIHSLSKQVQLLSP